MATIAAARSLARHRVSSVFQKITQRGFAFQKSFHFDTPQNNAETPFDFTDENYVRVNAILAKYPDQYQRAAVIPLLDLAQRQHGGWLPLSAMHKVAEITHVAPVRVYEVASFYSMFNRNPIGTYFLQLCGTTPCMICGSEEIKQTITNELGIKEGETTKDGMFTLLEVECLGACANAPMMQINDDYYECLTPASTITLIKACQAHKLPPVGKWGSLPLNGQLSCEGPLGKTSLHTIPVYQTDPNRFAKGNVDPASVKKHMGY